MYKLETFYKRIGVKKEKIKNVFFMEGIYLLIFGVCKFFINGFGKTAMYNASAVILMIGLCIVIYSGNSDGTPEGMELVQMLELYPVNLNKLYPLLVRDAVKFCTVHMLVSMLIASEMNVGYTAYIVMILIDIVVFLYFILCYHIGLCDSTDECSLGTSNAVCFLLSPLLMVAVRIIYLFVL